ncbi:MAG: hypothetical protein ACR2LK_10350 [Solirubrobacteraceae bacterium]
MDAELDRALRTVIDRCLRVGAGETVLVDMRLDLRERAAIADDGDLSSRGAFGNLPCGEGFVSPAGAVHEDVVVLDPSLWIGSTQVLDAGRYLL